ncbi:SEC14-like protein 5 isoform X2 [Anneissia japonica]|uniref:SEC14-like protein 5 isoform X1 n=1 Tax=Anneissia japonica TaxID=1529436 RepID=UPI0014258B11|nr:SEC14-like protein 5 isoform X1 [Anneissia japonica]XP_033112478.1 SEC14-like protein 5 isoform X2 [Anneissia japonica]
MVQTYQSPVRVYKYPFEVVMAAYEKRFPTCKMIPIFLGSEIVSDKKSPDGAVHVVERRCKLNLDAPYLLKKIVGVDHVYFIQTNCVNWRERTLKIEARNESFSSRVHILEGCVYSVHPDNPHWTCFEQTANLEVKSFFGFENSVEKVAVKQYANNIKKGKEILTYYINEVLEKSDGPIPTWSELHPNEDPRTVCTDVNGVCPSTAESVPSTSNQEASLISPSTETISSQTRTRLASSVKENGGAVGGYDDDGAVSKVDEEYIARFLGNLTPLQESKLIELREWLSDTHKEKEKMPHDAHLLRFLRARDFNTEKAHEMITASLSWRKQHKVDKILGTWEPPELLTNYWPGGWHYNDTDGRPVYVMKLGQVDVKGLMKTVGEEMILRHILSINEEGIRRTEEATRKTGRPISDWTSVVDLEGLSMRHLWRPGIKALLRIIEVVEANYPETMGKLLIVRAPRVFPIIWTLISPFIDENTRQKFLIYGGKNYLDHGGLPDHVEDQYIPDFLGGDCFCDIPDGGIIPKVCYRSLDDILNPDEHLLCSETVYKSATLMKGQPSEVLVKISGAQEVLTWDFDVLRGDVIFSVLVVRKPINHPKETTGPLGNTIYIDKSMFCGIDYGVIESALVCKAGESIQGSHVCQFPGNYILQWKYYSPVAVSTSTKGHHHQHKSKIMYFHEVLDSENFRGSMTSLQSCQSGFSSLSISTTTSKSSGQSKSSSFVSR